VHLSGVANAADLFATEVGSGQRFPNRYRAGPPPVVRVLLRPSDLGGRKGRVIFRGGRNDTPARLDNNHSSAARSNVNTQDVDKVLLADTKFRYLPATI